MSSSPASKTRALAYGAAAAALYAGLTIALAPIGFGVIQLRVAEALCILPWFFPAAVPGLFVGCALANLLCGAEVLDVVFGSLATLAAALCARGIKKAGLSPWLVPLPAVLINAIVIGVLQVAVYHVPVTLWQAALYIGAEQAAACFGLGMPLFYVLRRIGTKLFGGLDGI